LTGLRGKDDGITFGGVGRTSGGVSARLQNEYVGAYIADMVVDNKIIVEVKSVTKLCEVMEAQLINYLKLSKLQVGYLFNFYNTRLEWRRFANTRVAAS
jgi:GxxExxY protein